MDRLHKVAEGLPSRRQQLEDCIALLDKLLALGNANAAELQAKLDRLARTRADCADELWALDHEASPKPTLED